MPKSIQEAIQREQRIQQLVQKFQLEDDDYEYEEAVETQRIVNSYKYNANQLQMENSYD